MATVLIAGGTGVIGTRLSQILLDKGYDVIILTRQSVTKFQNSNSSSQNLKYANWDPENKTIDKTAMQLGDVVINLAGAGIADKRWSSKRKKKIVESRVGAGETIVKALTEIPNKIKLVINISGQGWYGSDAVRDPQKPAFTEDDPAFQDFLGDTCRQWEESIQTVTSLGKRLVIFRTGIVLSNEGGAFIEFRKPLRFGIAAILGNGKQVISWIHIDDLCRLFIFAIENNQISGVYNSVAPNAVDNKTFMTKLGSTLRPGFFIPVYVPAFILKIMLGELSIEVLKSTTVSCEKIKKMGFQFVYPTVDSAFKDLANKS